jgi:hypothetical protein
MSEETQAPEEDINLIEVGIHTLAEIARDTSQRANYRMEAAQSLISLAFETQKRQQEAVERQQMMEAMEAANDAQNRGQRRAKRR